MVWLREREEGRCGETRSIVGGIATCGDGVVALACARNSRVGPFLDMCLEQFVMPLERLGVRLIAGS